MKKADSWYKVQDENGESFKLKHFESNGSLENHSIDPEEVRAFCVFFNTLFSGDPLLQHLLPLDVGNDDLFNKQQDGLLLIQLLNHTRPGIAPEKKFHSSPTMSIFQKLENLNLVIDCANQLGCKLVNIDARIIFDGR